MIRKIHQIWYQGQENIPDTFRQYSSRWKKINTGFEHTLWDSNSIDMFMKKHYPSVYNNFLSLPYMIQKIDVFKYAVLNKQGGFYIDMDVDCLRPLTTLPSKYHDSDFIASRAPSFFYENLVLSGEIDLYNNAVLYSRPNNTILDKMIHNSFSIKCANISKMKCVFMTTGPIIFTKTVNRLKTPKTHIISSFFFEPAVDIPFLNKKQIGKHYSETTWTKDNITFMCLKYIYSYVRYAIPFIIFYLSYFHVKRGLILLILYLCVVVSVKIYISNQINQIN